MKEGIPMATPTPQREQAPGLAWLARQLRWEQSLDALRADSIEAPEDERRAA
jgi:hypothetical protein